jgi:hypothetical protein
MLFAGVMYTLPPILSPASGRSERLARLVYELLDAHSDTERLIRGCSEEQEWRAHLGYLRDLQRVGREVLAEHIDA